MVLKECLMNKTKKCNSVIFSNLKTKRGSGWTVLREVQILCFRERMCAFSLGFWSIRPRFSTEQEGKLFYTARATCGH